MYNLFYKLRKSPFSLGPDPDFLYLSPKHQNALAVLERSLANWVGLSAITGEKGTGKSTLIRYLLKQSWPDVTFGLISESDSPPGSLLKRTLSAFGLNSYGKTTTESYDLLSDFMVIDCFWKKRQPVLIIDESLGMESRALEELYMLSTMEPEENRNLRIILAMPPSLWETLKRPTWTHLARRVGNNYQLETLNYQETVAYVQHRLRVAGAQNENLFDDPAYKAIFRYSGGNPRLINVLCNAALVQGAIQEKPQIGAALIKDLILQKLWLRAAITAPRGEALRRPETEGKNVDQAAGILSDTDNLPPAVGRVAKRDKTGQTVSEFIIADIDHASRKYVHRDAEVSKASDDKPEPTGEAPQRADRRLLRVASIAVIILVTAAVAILFDWDRFSRESQPVQRDQDTQGLITAFRPSEEARQNLDLPDPIQAVNESASVVRKLLAQQENRDDADSLAGDEGVPEDAMDEMPPSMPIEPASELSEPVRGQDEGSVPQESKDNTTQFVAEDETRTTASGSEAPSISIEPAPEQSEPVGDQDEASVPQESLENSTQRVAEDETRAPAPDPAESESMRSQDEGPVPQESSENSAQLVAEDETRATASDPAESESMRSQDEASVPQESLENSTQRVAEDETRATAPDPAESESMRSQDEGPVPQESSENSAQLVAEDETRPTAPGSGAPSMPVEPVPEESDPDSGQDEGSLPNESKDPTAGLIVKDEMHANASDTRESSVPVNSDPNRSRSGGTESVEPYIAELLARAEQQIAAKHLVTPAGDAALETYQSILELVPGHIGASQGINRIKDLYLAWARATRQRGLWAKAQSFAEKAVTVDPQDTDAAQLLDQIKAERKLEAEVAALKQLEVEKAKAAVTPVEGVTALRKPEVKALKKTTPQPVAPAQELDTVPSDLQAQRVREVDNLLIKAQEQSDVQHLTQPAGDNAWETYQKVLQLDPTNQHAKESVQRIAQRIESMALDTRQNGDLLTSMAIIEEGLRVMPDHSGLLALKEDINRQLEAQRVATQVEDPPAPVADKEEPPKPKKKKRRRVKSFGTFF